VAPTPNRSDCLSIRGLAIELSAVLGRPLRSKGRGVGIEGIRSGDGGATHAITVGSATVPAPWHVSGAAEPVTSVAVLDGGLCGRYLLATLEGLVIAPSPLWMQRRLEAVGQRPINNAVDVTNYVLFEHGQPLHAFDARKIRGGRIVVRTAEEGEAITTLDGTDRVLLPADVVIADASGPVALAGVMGGANSEVGDSTTTVALECAVFAPSAIRKTARRLGLRSESSHRFERGIDDENMDAALCRAIELLAAVQPPGAERVRVSQNVHEARGELARRTVIRLPYDLATRRLGIPVAPERTHDLLVALGLDVVDGADGHVVEVPRRRHDLARPIDLVEEVGRLTGYGDLPDDLPAAKLGGSHARRTKAPVRQDDATIVTQERQATIEHVRHLLAASGVHEAVTWGFVDPEKLARVSDRQPLRVLNPLGAETAVMRTSLLPGLLNSLAHNLARGAERVALFEVGSTFSPTGEGTTLAVVLHGREGTQWSAARRDLDGLDAVGLIERISAVLRRRLHVVTGVAPRWAHPGVYASVKLDGHDVGWVGALHPTVTEAWEVEGEATAIELDLESILRVPREEHRFGGLPRTQASRRDVALVVESSVTWESIASVLAPVQRDNAIIESFRLFDVYEGAQVGEGRRSLAIRLTYRDEASTLKDERVDAVHAQVVGALGGLAGASLR
jgi:phenylalanyl-tRNA synthetase beta chain